MAADYEIEVEINPSRARRGRAAVESELNALERSANRLKSTLAGALAFAGIGVGIAGLISLADQYTNIENRIRSVTASQAEAAVVSEEVYQIAQRTRQSWQGTAEVYSRTALAARDLGLSQRDVLRFTESLNQAIVLSGASAQEAQAGMIQLSQGLASGTLRGDELRSVLEQLPAVADVIAKRLGVTRGELREMGEDGKISAMQVIDAFRDAEAELDERFANTTPTIAQGFMLVRDAAARFFGEVASSSGILGGFANGLLFVARNFETIMRVTVAAATVLAVRWAAGALAAAGRATIAYIGQLIALELALGATSRGAALASIAMKALQFVLLANPITFLITALTTAIALLISFSDKILLGTNEVTTLADYGKAAWEFMVQGIKDFLEFIDPAIQGLRDLAKWAGEKLGIDLDISTFADALRAAAQGLDAFFGFFGGLINAGIAIWNGFGGAISDLFIQAVNAVIDGINSMSSGFITFVNGAIGLFTGLAGGVIAAFQAIPQAFRSIFQTALNGVIQLVGPFLNQIIGALNELPLVDIAMVNLAGVAQEAMPDVGVAARAGFQRGFNAGQLFDPNALRIDRIENTYAGQAEQLGNAVTEGFNRGMSFNGFETTLNQLFARADQIAQERLAAEEAAAAGLGQGGANRTSPGGDDEAGRQRRQRADDAAKELERQRQVLSDWNRDTAQEIVLLGLSNRARERQEEIYRLENDLKRELTATERQLVEARLDEVAAARDAKYLRDLTDDLERENEILRTNVEDRAIRAEILRIEADIGRQLTPIERERVENLMRENEALDRQNKLYESITGQSRELAQSREDLNALYAQGRIGIDEYNRALYDLRIEEIQDRIRRGSASMADGFIAELARMSEAARSWKSTAGSIFGQFFDQFSQGVGDSIGRAIVFSEDLGASLLDVARNAVSSLISSLVQLGIQILINKLIMKAFGDETVVGTGAQAAALAAAWAPAAAFASLATLGSNVGPAIGGIALTVAAATAIGQVSKAFANGGFVSGPGGPRDDAILARLSNGEFVVNAQATKNNRAALEAINAGGTLASPAPSSGLSVGASGDVYSLDVSGGVHVHVPPGTGASDAGAIGREVKQAVISITREEFQRQMRSGGALTKARKSVMSGN